MPLPVETVRKKNLAACMKKENKCMIVKCILIIENVFLTDWVTIIFPIPSPECHVAMLLKDACLLFVSLFS